MADIHVLDHTSEPDLLAITNRYAFLPGDQDLSRTLASFADGHDVEWLVAIPATEEPCPRCAEQESGDCPACCGTGKVSVWRPSEAERERDRLRDIAERLDSALDIAQRALQVLASETRVGNGVTQDEAMMRRDYAAKHSRQALTDLLALRDKGRTLSERAAPNGEKA